MTERENALQILRGGHAAWIPDAAEVVEVMETPILQRPENTKCRDAYGVSWVPDLVSGGSVYEVGQKPIIDDMEDWKASVKFPDVRGADWEACAAKVDHSQDKVFSVILLMGPLERMEALCGMEACMCNLLEYPEESAELALAIAENHAEIIRCAAEYLKPDFFVVHDDWGTEKSLFIGRDTWKEIIYPATRVIYEAVKETGVPVIQHSCGKMEPLLDEIVALGADGWESNQVCNDLPAICGKYGDRILYMGTMDVREYMTEHPDEAATRAFMARQIRMFAQHGRYFPETNLDSPIGEQKAMERWFREELARYNRERFGTC